MSCEIIRRNLLSIEMTIFCPVDAEVESNCLINHISERKKYKTANLA